MNTPTQGKTGATVPQNDFKPFATNRDANIIGQAEYETLAALGNGFAKGLAKSSELNKVMRQSSSITAALARFATAKTGEALLDNGDIDTLCRQIETAIGSVSSLLIAEAQGSADALTAYFTPTLKELENGLLVHVRAREKNTGASPSFNADETGAKPVVKGNNLPLAIGDIAGAGHWLELQYDSQLDKWVLQNPAKGITPQSGVPIGTIEYFAMPTPPAGYLKADGAAVGRETYPDLYAAIGTTFGEGDGSTTFNLPDLIDRFAQGSNTPGQKLLAGLPNIDGEILQVGVQTNLNATGAFFDGVPSSGTYNGHNGNTTNRQLKFDASRSNPIYGASNTVQPPALTLLPCIKAFDAATNPGLIDITELANEVATHKHVTETYNDGTNWYRKWSDGWLEQGGHVSNDGTGLMSVSLLIPFSSANYCISITSERSAQSTTLTDIKELGYHSKTAVGFKKYLSVNKTYEVGFGWYACGQGAQS
ncbi:phage tail protein [Oxalobacter formigenes]